VVGVFFDADSHLDGLDLKVGPTEAKLGSMCLVKRLDLGFSHPILDARWVQRNLQFMLGTAVSNCESYAGFPLEWASFHGIANRIGNRIAHRNDHLGSSIGVTNAHGRENARELGYDDGLNAQGSCNGCRMAWAGASEGH